MTWLTWNVIAVGEYGKVWICTRLPRMTVRWVCALFRQRGEGGDVIVIVLAVASRTMLQQIVAPNTNIGQVQTLTTCASVSSVRYGSHVCVSISSRQFYRPIAVAQR